MPRAHKHSDDVYNARRRAKRALERVNKQIGSASGELKKELQQQAASLKQTIEASRYDRKNKRYNVDYKEVDRRTEAARDFVYVKVTGQARELSKAENRRKNEMLKAFWKSAKRTEAQKATNVPRTPEQRFARAEQSFVYKMTLPLWQGGDVELRDENILAALSKIKLPKKGRHISNMQDVADYLKQKYPNDYPTYGDFVKNGFDVNSEESSPEDSNQNVIAPTLSMWRSVGADV